IHPTTLEVGDFCGKMLKRKTEENPRTRRTNIIYQQWLLERRDYNNFWPVIGENNVQETRHPTDQICLLTSFFCKYF
ncbi:MAG: hypothetical protein ACTHW0_06890, partial [Psychrobacter sp.]